MQRALAMGLGLAVFCAAPAAAAPPWSVQEIPGSDRTAEHRAPTFDVAPDGSGVVGWWDTGTSVRSSQGLWAASVRPHAPGAPVSLGAIPSRSEPQVLPLASGRIAVFGILRAGVATGRLGGPLTVRLRWPAGDLLPASAVGPRGDLAVLGPVRSSRFAPSRLVLGIVRRDGKARTVIVSRRRTTRGFAVALNGHGDALVAYDVASHPPGRGIRHTIFARVVRAGRRPGPAFRLGRSRGFVTIAVAFDDARRAAVGWFGRGCSEDGDCAVGTASAAIARREARFGPAVHLGSTPAASTSRAPGPVQVALGTRGRGVVAWSAAVEGGPMGVFAAGIAGGRIGDPQRLSDPRTDGWLADLAGTPGGGAAVAWFAAAPGGPATLLASVRPAGGAFGTPETVADEPVAEAPIRIAFDPVSARYMVILRPSADPARPLLALATRSSP